MVQYSWYASAASSSSRKYPMIFEPLGFWCFAIHLCWSTTQYTPWKRTFVVPGALGGGDGGFDANMAASAARTCAGASDRGGLNGFNADGVDEGCGCLDFAPDFATKKFIMSKTGGRSWACMPTGAVAGGSAQSSSLFCTWFESVSSVSRSDAADCSPYNPEFVSCSHTLAGLLTLVDIPRGA